MKIQVKWFKETGKFYSGGLVEIGNNRLFDEGFKQAIVDNQDNMLDEWVNHGFYVVTDSTEEQDNNPKFTGFYTYLFHPEAFKGMQKSAET